ncbi:hypothetical protein MVEN_02171300 [Mycena venus]|uniref:Uncharacterized protein n=1 Tax=Mycena venus TaxID=2733690 RepID=A0A8H7CFY5_9AGAR|nr:hypothetical protein MVEN_02171300 [Mycena venus]
MPGVSLPLAELIGHTLASVSYGVYLVTLGIVVGQRRRSKINWVILVVSVVLFVNATLNLVVVDITIVEAFVLYTGPGGAETILTDGSGWKNMIRAFNVPFQSLVGDAILIYRCWYLWSKSWLLIALPLLIWFTNVACTIRFLDLLSRLSKGLVIADVIQPWLQAFWSMTICINVITTSLIVVRIWKVEKQNRRFRASAGVNTGSSHQDQSRSILSHAMRNIIESGMIYTVVSIFTLATYVMQTPLHYTISALEIHSVGITFNLILIRSGRVSRSRPDATVSVPLEFTQTLTMDRESMIVISDGEGMEGPSRLHKGPEFPPAVII